MPAFKATITLAKLTEREPDNHGYARVDTETIAEVTVTADSPAHAMRQIHEHATALNDWYAE